jgi:hypothetical protein
MSKSYRKFDRQTADKIRHLKRDRNRQDDFGDNSESYKGNSKDRGRVMDEIYDNDWRNDY